MPSLFISSLASSFVLFIALSFEPSFKSYWPFSFVSPLASSVAPFFASPFA